MSHKHVRFAHNWRAGKVVDVKVSASHKFSGAKKVEVLKVKIRPHGAHPLCVYERYGYPVYLDGKRTVKCSWKGTTMTVEELLQWEGSDGKVKTETASPA